MDINKAWIVFPLFFIILSATTTYSAVYLKPGSAYFNDTDHPELDYSELYANMTIVNTSSVDINQMDTNVQKTTFLGIDMPDIFGPVRDIYLMIGIGLSVPSIIGTAIGLEPTLVITLVAIMSLLSMIGFIFFLRGTV
jgi:hypothetical protein